MLANSCHCDVRLVTTSGKIVVARNDMKKWLALLLDLWSVHRRDEYKACVCGTSIVGLSPVLARPVLRRLQSFGEFIGFCFGKWGEMSEPVHPLIHRLAQARLRGPDQQQQFVWGGYGKVLTEKALLSVRSSLGTWGRTYPSMRWGLSPDTCWTGCSCWMVRGPLRWRGGGRPRCLQNWLPAGRGSW